MPFAPRKAEALPPTWGDALRDPEAPREADLPPRTPHRRYRAPIERLRPSRSAQTLEERRGVPPKQRSNRRRTAQNVSR